METGIQTATKSLYVLALDGGGAKGFYTLGVLRQIQALIGQPIYKKFNLIFGTSTGSIIASLLALGTDVEEIHRLYKTHVLAITRQHTAKGRSAALKKLVGTVYGDKKFDAFKTDIGIVATKWDLALPMIFKTNLAQAHGRHATFVPGFGCTIADAVQASCAAYPIFNRHTVTLQDGTAIELADGGFCANNPALYAITDAAVAMNVPLENVHLVSIGVGVYPKPKLRWHERVYVNFQYTQALMKFMDSNTNSMDHLRHMLFRNIDTVRIDETFSQPELAMDFLERDVDKLDKIFQRGGDSFAKCEQQLRSMLT